jgi:ketopantoate reductase
MAVAGNKCLRRHPRLEIGLRERCPVRHLIQVGCAHQLDSDVADHTQICTVRQRALQALCWYVFSTSAVSGLVLTLHAVVRTPEDAAHSSKQPFDYVLLCVKALPDVYDIANIIESVVAPQHTCILMNTTHSIGVESYLEQRFPTNVVLSLVSGAEIVQLGASEFEHKGATDIWVGPANKNAAIPAQIQSDMAEALSMTLSSGQVDCKVSPNIRQQQYERMIGFVLPPFRCFPDVI